jgi:transcriptional regulator with XRE-family HTH domain
MQSLGSYLSELRTARGVSLEELARITRVGQTYLQALEAEAFKRLPAPVFTKGFIRAYCLALGESPDEALSRYREIQGTPPAQPAPQNTLRPKARGHGPVLVSLVLLLVLGLALFLVVGLQGRLRGGGGSGGAVASAPKRITPGVVATPAPRPDEASRLRLVARTTEPTWVRVQLDDGSVVQELLPAGATREWVSGKRFVLTVGNAGGIALELNGQAIPPLGARGAVVQNLVIPAEPEAGKP